MKRIQGADAEGLKNSMEKSVTPTTLANPVSSTEKLPAGRLAFQNSGKRDSIVEASVDDVEEKQKLNARLKTLMEKDNVVLFMKGSPDAPRCGFSRRIVKLLQDQGAKFSSFDILSDESVRQGIHILDKITFPYLTQ